MAKKIVFYILVVWMYYPSLFLGGLGVVVGLGVFFVVVVFVGLVFFNQSYLFTHCRGGEHEIMLRYR